MMHEQIFSDEDRAAILEAAREAIEAAQAALDAPRAEIEPPPVEDRVARWRREADEQAARFAAERAKPWPLTEYEVAERERAAAQVNAVEYQLAEQKRFILDVVAHVVAELQDQFAERLEKLEESLGQVRAELTIAKAYSNNNNNSGGEVVDLRKSA